MKLNKLPEAIEVLETAVRLDPELNNDLMEGNDTAASPVYSKLKTLSPAVARSVRDRVIAGGFAGAKNLLE